MKNHPSRLRQAAAVALFGALATLAPTSGLLTSPATAGRADIAVSGADISWPECPTGTGIPSRQGEGKPMPQANADFVVVGVTNGPGFYPNPCLQREFNWMKNHHVWGGAYAMTTYPSAQRIATYGSTGPHPHRYLHGKLWNTGYAQAEFNVATMDRVGLEVPFVWVDVEPYPTHPWTRTKANNAAVVRGVVKGYEDAGYRVGFYSTQSQWAEVVGSLRYGYPEWRTAGQTSRSSALSTCTAAPVQGGRAVLAQWWDPQRDFDVMCPGYGRASVLRTYFHQY